MSPARVSTTCGWIVKRLLLSFYLQYFLFNGFLICFNMHQNTKANSFNVTWFWFNTLFFISDVKQFESPCCWKTQLNSEQLKKRKYLLVLYYRSCFLLNFKLVLDEFAIFRSSTVHFIVLFFSCTITIKAFFSTLFYTCNTNKFALLCISTHIQCIQRPSALHSFYISYTFQSISQWWAE